MAPRSKAAPQEALEDEVGVMRAEEPEEADTSVSTGEPAAQRKRVYNGSAGLVVEDPEESRGELEDLARDSGGYIESSYSEYVVLRVPADRFDVVFERVLTLGRVEYSRVETWDVTEAFADIEQRLDTAEETRRRLYVLLERSTDPTERARILREIGRLTEEIESLKQQMALMEQRISFSRISIQLIPRIQGEVSRNQIPFDWIAWLDPLSPAGDRLRAKVVVDFGESFAVFSKDAFFLAENPEGLQIIMSTVDNTPRGDNAFWQRALAFHLESFYASLDERSVDFGELSCDGVELVSKDREPYRYFVGIIADGRRLHIVEIFSPNDDVDFQPLYRALSEGVIR